MLVPAEWGCRIRGAAPEYREPRIVGTRVDSHCRVEKNHQQAAGRQHAGNRQRQCSHLRCETHRGASARPLDA